MKTLTLEEAREFVRKCGAIPLFDNYINSYAKYRVGCSCGREDIILFSTLGRNIKKDSNYKFN